MIFERCVSSESCCTIVNVAAKKKRRKRKGHYHTGVHVSTKTGQACKFRSGWEQKYLEWLDANDTVKTYVYEGVKIPYVSNVKTGKIRTYNPDFLVEYMDGTRVLVEIKPSRRVKQVKVQKKLKAAQRWCDEHNIILSVLTEVELKQLGLL